MTSEGAAQNLLLSKVPHEDLRRFTAAGEILRLARGSMIYEPGRPITHVYFPISGIISFVAVMSNGEMTEVGTIGDEGMAGLPVFFGAEQMPMRAFQQVAGESFRVPARRFLEEIEHLPQLQTAIRRYAQAFWVQAAQSAACNRRHPVEERCARWLLMTRTQVHSNELALTQEFLAEMLGVRRPSVTVAAGALQKAGMIRYSHGKITILDPERLEAAACECYDIVRSEYDRLLGAR